MGDKWPRCCTYGSSWDISAAPAVVTFPLDMPLGSIGALIGAPYVGGSDHLLESFQEQMKPHTVTIGSMDAF